MTFRARLTCGLSPPTGDQQESTEIFQDSKKEHILVNEELLNSKFLFVEPVTKWEQQKCWREDLIKFSQISEKMFRSALVLDIFPG
jgi:hypothetical protein